jgi:succinoglycan biosynthesis transport protein ExoP
MNEHDLVQNSRKYIAMLHKRRALVATCLGCSLLVALLYNYTSRPVYQATAQILIDRDAPTVLPAQDRVGLPMPNDDGGYQTQYQLLAGRNLAEAALQRLNLQKSPELQTGPMMSPWERIQRNLLGRVPESTVGADGIPLSPAAAAFRSRLVIEPRPGGRLVYLRFTAYDPRIAADAANTLAQLYIEQSLEFRYTTSSEANAWLSARVRDQQQQLREAEQRLEAYRTQQGLVNVEDRRTLVDQKLAALSSAAVAARTERISRETLYRQIAGLSREQLRDSSLVMGSSVIQGMKARLSDLQGQQASLSETFGERHPDMQRLTAEIAALQEKIDAEMAAVVRQAQGDYQTALQQEQSLLGNLEGAKQEALSVNTKALEFGALQREVEASAQLLRDLMNRTKQTGLQTELKTTNVRVVERADVPRTPISPRRAWNYQVALLVGLGLGIGLTLLFEHLDSTLKTPEDVKEHLGLPFLGMVPDVGASVPRQVTARPSPLILDKPQSAVAEAYRVLRTNLLFTSGERAGRVLLVSSASPGEGKSTTVVNLAASLAQNGARVLAVDADLRRPTLHQHFGIEKMPGVSDVVIGRLPLAEALRPTVLETLTVLPCGYVPPNPAELLGSTGMRDLIESLRQRYDFVLIDTPPILALADTPVLSRFADGLVLVVGAEISSRSAVQRTVDQILAIGGKITGVVLNKVDLERNSYYYGQYYGEYYRSYYAAEDTDAARRHDRAV